MTMTDWDKYNSVRLAESVDTRGEDPEQTLEIYRKDSFVIGTNPPELKERRFNITVYVGDEDLTFHGLTARKVCEIAETMIRLVGGALRVDPPDDPEIKF
jgi:hypothetical protein